MQKEYKVSLYQINWGASPASEGSDRLQCEVSLDEESRKRISKITLIFEFYDMKKLVVSPMEVTYVYPVIPLIRESPIWIHADFPRVKDAVYMRLANVVFDDKEEVHVRLKSNISNKMMRNSFKLPTGKDSRPASFSTQTKWIQQKAAETPGNVDVETLGIPRPIRTWTARSGHKIEAALQKTEQETVFLTGADGNTLKVPIAALSGADADYISSQRPSSRK